MIWPRGNNDSHEILVYPTSVFPGGEGGHRQASGNDHTQPTQISVMEIILQLLKDKDSNIETYMTSLFLTL